ncbi:MAG: hypothetical protein ACI9G5_001808 [Paracoccaceae bacterium]
MESGQLVVVEGAIVDKQALAGGDKTIRFYKNIDVSVWGTVAESWAQRNELLGTSNNIIEVPMVDFSACLQEFGIPHYLKIDIEGMDRACLEALLEFERKPDYVSIESEKVSFAKLLLELDLLSQLGYTKFKVVQQSGIARQKEPKPAREGDYVGYRFQEGASGLFGEDVPGRWVGLQKNINMYKSIFLQYKLFGDYALLRRNIFTRTLINGMQRMLRTPLPGWYDTHAKHSSAG